MQTRSSFIKCLFAASLAIVSWLDRSAAQDRVSIPFVAEAGDTFIVSIEKERVDKKDSQILRHVRARFSYDGLIRDVSDDGMTVVWTLRDFNAEKIAGGKDNSNFDAEAILQFMKRPISFKTDQFGNPVKFENYGELKNVLSQAASSDPASKEALDYFKRTLFSLDDETAARVFLQEAAYLGRGQSFDVPLHETIEETTQLPNPLGGPPIDTSVRTRVLKESSDSVQIETAEAFDRESAKRSIGEVVKRLAQKDSAAAAKIQEQIEKSAISRDDVVIYTVEKVRGWTTVATLDRRIVMTIDGTSQDRLEKWKIEVVPK